MRSESPKNQNPDYYRCPVCGHKLARLEPGAAAKGVYVWCKHCKREREIKTE